MIHDLPAAHMGYGHIFFLSRPVFLKNRTCGVAFLHFSSLWILGDYFVVVFSDMEPGMGEGGLVWVR